MQAERHEGAAQSALDCNEGVVAAPSCSLQRMVRGHGRTHLDLFSGIGGFALAAQRAGWSTIGLSEIEPYACKILKRHWPDVPNYGDIRNVRGVRADLVTGGFPCQPYSVAGQQRGDADDRALWPEMLRVIQEARPRWVLGENVPGIVSMALDGVLSDLERNGYACDAVGIPACGVDARHRRERIWIVAHSERAGQQDGRAAGDSGMARSGEEWKAPENLRATPPESGGVRGGQRWAAEPRMDRVAHGIPNRVDRLRGLGNAIVPQVAERLLRWMLELDETRMTPNDKIQQPL